MTKKPDYHHVTSIEIRFADIDSMGHVNNAKYLTFLENARIKYFTDVLGRGMYNQPGFILAKTTIDFLSPIKIQDEIKVFTRCCRIGTKSFDLEYEISRISRKTSEAVARAVTVLVAYDYEKNESIALPDKWKKQIEKYEKKPF